jgi:hypothetical protein
MPDWYYVDNITPEQAATLTELENLRTDFPVYWALIQGYQTSESIAKLINWPHTYTLNTLRSYKTDGGVTDQEGIASVVWKLTDGVPEYLEYQRWVHRQKQPRGLFRRIDRNDE